MGQDSVYTSWPPISSGVARSRCSAEVTGFVSEDSHSFLDAAAGILENREISACPGSVSCSNTVGLQKPGRHRDERKDLVAWDSAKALILRPASLPILGSRFL